MGIERKEVREKVKRMVELFFFCGLIFVDKEFGWVFFY